MAVISRVNQYQGINAHFQSYAQWERDGWASFHHHYITYLLDEIDPLLPPGYEAAMERSIQIRMNDAHDEMRIAAVVIRDISTEGKDAIPVTRIELLSPANKTGSGAAQYLTKRDAALESGTVLVEIDFLHETNSIILGVPGYASREQGAYPYVITVSNPRPSIEKGYRERYGFGIEERVLPIRVPLAGEENIILDFGAVYNRVFSANSAYCNRADYAREPKNFHAYTRDDQKRIWGRMLAVIDVVRTGGDLSQALFPAVTPETDSTFQSLENYAYQEAALLVDEKTFRVWWLLCCESNLMLLHRDSGSQPVEISPQAESAEHLYQRLKSIFESQGAEAFLTTLPDVSGAV